MYTVQNKVLPGAYINFVSAARASATLGDRGTAAFPLSLDWGPENEVVTIENSEFQKGSLALTGYASAYLQAAFAPPLFRRNRCSVLAFAKISRSGRSSSAV